MSLSPPVLGKETVTLCSDREKTKLTQSGTTKASGLASRASSLNL